VLGLGAGIGLHALQLAHRGFSVLAVDSCQAPLDELKAGVWSLAIRTLSADLVGCLASLATAPDIVLCRGDTLTHLPDRASFEPLFTEVAGSFRPGGLFVATCLDYVSSPLHGAGRFIAVRGDARRILTCFLEYAGGGCLRSPGPARFMDLAAAIRSFVAGVKGPTNLTVADAEACVPANCYAIVTMSEESAQPTCTLRDGTTLPREIFSCTGASSSLRFRPSFSLCRQGGIITHIELGEDVNQSIRTDDPELRTPRQAHWSRLD
jgi:hypothetical protein